MCDECREFGLDEELHAVILQLHRFNKTFKRLVDFLTKPHKDFKLYIKWKGQGNIQMANDVTLNLTPPFGTNQAVPVELENGNPFTFDPATIAWSVQNAAIASFVQNSDGSATFTPLTVGVTGVAVMDNATGALTQGTLTVQGAPNQFTLSINWQTPASGQPAQQSVNKFGSFNKG